VLAETTASLVFGLTVAEWAVLAGALIALYQAVAQRHRANQSGSKLEILADALEEVHTSHPEAAKVAKRFAHRQATEMGIEVGRWGLGADAMEAEKRAVTRRLDREKAALGGNLVLGPDDETPGPEAA